MLANSSFQFLVECCAGRPTCEQSLIGSVDWTQLLALARRHRVQGLVSRAVAQKGAVPQAIADALAGDARQIAADGLRCAAESRRLLDAFGDAGANLLFLKGLAVAGLAYGDPFVKMSADIDILVRPEDIGIAASILVDLGYRLTEPRDPAHLQGWHRSRKESVWVKAGSLPVELHSRVADHPDLLPSLDACSPRQRVEIAPNLSLPTLARDELFAYLAVHGASSAWFRLKWLCDFATLLRDVPSDEVDRRYRRSLGLEAGRAAGLALLLSQRLFGIALSSNLNSELKEDGALRLLERVALRQLTRIAEPTATPFGTLGIHATQLLLRPGARFAVSEGLRQVRAFVGAR